MNKYLVIVMILVGGSGPFTSAVGKPESLSGRDPFLSPKPTSALTAVPSPITAVPSVLETDILTIRYADTEQLAQLIQGKGQPSWLSPAGIIAVDPRTNTLIVRDSVRHLQAIRKLVKRLDVPVRQVEIEARIVMMREGATEELGVRWGVSSKQRYGSVGGHIENQYVGLSSGEQNVASLLNVSLPASSSSAASIAFQLARLGSGTLLDLELSALQNESRAEVISSPRLLTTNRKPAFIEQGTEIPYLASSDNGENNIAFKKAVLSLKVTPYITPEQRLILDLNVTQDRPGQVVKTGTGEAVAIVTQRIGTQVVVNDGETIVLGGIYQENNTKGVDKVPVLGDVPVVGSLFRRTYQEKGKSELVIFVTPKIKIQ